MKKIVVLFLTALLILPLSSCGEKEEEVDINGYYELISVVRDGEEIMTDSFKEEMKKQNYLIYLDVSENRGTLYMAEEVYDYIDFNPEEKTYSSVYATYIGLDDKDLTYTLKQGKLTLNNYDDSVFTFEKKERPSEEEPLPSVSETPDVTEFVPTEKYVPVKEPTGDVLVVENDYITLYVPMDLPMLIYFERSENSFYILSDTSDDTALVVSFPYSTEEESNI